jgi:hypothetical protein
MAQSGFTPIKLYSSSTSGAVPSASNLAAGELAINTADGKLFYKDFPGGAVQVIASKNPSSLVVSYQPAGTGAVTTTVQAKLRQTVSIKDFGAAGDGTTNDATAVLNALQSGFVVDGGGLTYAVSGTVTPSSFVGLQNANFIQIGNNTATNFQLLNIVGLNNFFIDNVSINMGTNITTLFSDSGNSGLYVGGSSASSYSQNFKITRVSVTGNGCGTGIQIRNSKRFNVDNCLVRDRVSGSSPDPTDDSQNGFAIINCADFVVSNSLVYNLLTRLSGTNTNKWTRGFLFTEIRDASIIGCNSTTNDQGFDFSGGITSDYPAGNRRFVISGCTSNNCGTYGFKFANVTRDALVSGCIANNTGTIGFVFSPSATTLANPALNTQNIDVVGCKVVNVLGTGWSSANSQGFRVMANSTYTDYPRSIRLSCCSVIDTQDTPTTLIGYISDSLIPQYPTAGYNESVANTTQNCTVSSNIPTPFSSSIGPNICVVTGTSTQSISSGTYTSVNWDFNLSDTTRLHNTVSNNNSIYIKTAGWYQLHAQIQFATNATGSRRIRFTNKGSVIDRTNTLVGAVSGTSTSVSSSIVTYLQNGDYVAVLAFQDSGGALNVLNNESNFSVTFVG